MNFENQQNSIGLLRTVKVAVDDDDGGLVSPLSK